MYVYIKSEPEYVEAVAAGQLGNVNKLPLYTVGFYRPDGRWMPESDHDNRGDAAARVHYLNGGTDPSSASTAGRPAFESEK